MTTTHQTASTARPSFSRHIGLIVLIGAVIGNTAYLMQTNRRLDRQMLALTQNQLALKQQQKDATDPLNAAIEAVNVKQSVFTEQLNAVSQQLSDALQARFYQNDDWLLLKARYDLELADINAHWSDNTQTTLALLQQADQVLINIHDPEIYPVRQAIANDILELQAIPTFDTVGILSTLDALHEQISHLPVKSLPKTRATPAETTAQASGFREQLKRSVRLLEKLVVIRHHEDSIEPLLSADHDALLRETALLNLQKAEWAVIQGHPEVYRQSLTHLTHTVNQTFDLADPRTQALLQKIQALQNVAWNSKQSSSDSLSSESLKLLNQVIDARKKLTGAK